MGGGGTAKGSSRNGLRMFKAPVRQSYAASAATSTAIGLLYTPDSPFTGALVLWRVISTELNSSSAKCLAGRNSTCCANECYWRVKAQMSRHSISAASPTSPEHYNT